MTPMTSAERERSRRVCEMLGATVCSLLTWYWIAEVVTSRNRLILFADWLTTVLLCGMLVGLAYMVAFCWLDVWWRKVYANYEVEMRPNWAVIPFLATWLALSISSLFFDIFQTDGRWFFIVLATAIAWGSVMWCIMFFFWCLGFIIRTVSNWNAAKA